MSKIFRFYSYVVFFCLLILSSCVTTSDLEYIRSNKDITIDKNIMSYTLQSGDLISVQISTTTEQQHDFFNKEQTSNSQLMIQNPYLYGYLIKEDGFLELPSLGKIKAEGFTLQELEVVISNIALSFFEKPVVKLNIINFDVTILGEVNNPGTFKIVKPNPNILYALSLAGDITQFGNRKKIKIIRNNNNVNQVFYIDLTDKNILNQQNLMAHPNDIIYIAPLKKKFYAFNNLPGAISMIISAVTLYILLNNN